MKIEEQVLEQLVKIYGHKADEMMHELSPTLEKFAKAKFPEKAAINQKNVYLIAYGDSIQKAGEVPLQTLRNTLNQVAKNLITDVHLLPMFPYTSDDGFSVVDYYEIDPTLGTWQDIALLEEDYRLMFDFVANHMSKSSEWFQKFLSREAGFEQAFIQQDEAFDATKVVRPRTSPLFHHYPTADGSLSAWTTFSEDQVDMNVQDGKMLARLTDVLLTYAQAGASSIRLDAIGFLWKESGTTSMHLKQTHEIIKLWRILLDYFSPYTQIITETNVPHKENISYFGNKDDEANMVYQFPLPPLVLNAFTKNDSQTLTKWAKDIHCVSETATYFNFLASHDGIGMRPTEGILTEEERNHLVEKVQKNGGKISYKSNPDGSQTVYELNINYAEALRNPGEDDQTAIKKMLAAHHILLSMVGVPAIYYHSLFGSKNDLAGFEKSGINRRINREKLDADKLLMALKEDHYRQEIFDGILHLIHLRQKSEHFSPYANQEVLDYGHNVFALRRQKKDSSSAIISITNVSPEPVVLQNIVGKEMILQQNLHGELQLEPYGIAWIEVENQ
ncbi:sugar phosphorylase [Isobaculum melis]|uniref:Sucrose phosphorylase n=1 Tax=Isobaculum melis TaxID=142588 RepID=A0A1H9Q3U6_9LACT|nr:sugar phosphorylase [Isobaculum melis]SER55110.1 sucrose phosphorylase [Isobaculum melis]